MNCNVCARAGTRLLLMAVLTFLIVGCDQPTLFGALDGETGRALQISPDSVTLAIHTDYRTSERQFSATGGEPPYTFTVVGDQADVGTITTDGLYRAPGTPETEIIVRVTDEFGNTSESDVTVTDLGTLEVSPSAATVLLGASLPLRASGGVPPYRFDLAGLNGTGENLDPDADGRSATYTAPSGAGTAGGSGVGDATVTLTDAAGNSTTTTITVTKTAALELLPASATIQLGEQIELTATGGVGPYTISLATGIGGTEEDLDVTAGQDSAVYTAPSDTGGSATVQVTDSAATPATVTATITVPDPAALELLPASATIQLGEQIELTATGGVGPYTISLATGIGGTEEDLDVTAGQDSAVYTAPSDTGGSATVQVTDSAATPATVTATITVPDPAALELLPDTSNVYHGGTVKLTAIGGVPPYTITLETALGGSGENLSFATGDDFATYTAPTDTLGDASVQVTDSAPTPGTATATVSVLESPDYGIPPAEVTDITATPGTNSVTLSWTNPSDADFATVEIWYGGSDNENTRFSGTIDPSGTVISGLSTGFEYSFIIRTVDTSGNVSNGAPAVTETPN